MYSTALFIDLTCIWQCWSGFPQLWLLEHGLSCEAQASLRHRTWALRGPGSHLCPLHWQAGSYPLCARGLERET